MAPKPGQVIGDPASGTGGLLLAAHGFIQTHHKLDKAARTHLKTQALGGTDIVPGVKLMRFGIRPISGSDTPEESGGFF